MDKDKGFEEMMQELEVISKELENGTLTLDESVKKFEEGIKISRRCSKILEEAEKKITILIKDSDNNINEENFEIE